ncbi:MAG: FAD:protein FMN transferase [Candidatus Omnitrophica bacterium]|nr:FAD:protein FMN transferase [Candidatus Omnitrophota bacterium]
MKRPGLEKYTESRPLMGTIVKVTACVDKEKKKQIKDVYDKVWEKLAYLESNLGIYNEAGDVYRINHSLEKEIEVSEDTYALIASAKGYNLITLGAFNIAVYPLIELWKDSEKNQVLPQNKMIEDRLSLIDNDNIELLGNNKIKLLDKEAKIDLGAIAPGYSADVASSLLRESGITSFFVDAGGEIFASGENCEGKPWKAGIYDPISKENLLRVIHLKDNAVSTSGDYERYFNINDRKYSYIIDPRRGLPEEAVISATVIAPKAVAADALSTAMCILGDEERLNLMEELGDGYASLVLKKTPEGNLEVVESPNFKKFISKE